jgi:hypothetical protein
MSLADNMKEDEMGRPCSLHGRDVYKIVAGNPEGKSPLGRLGIRGRIV